MCYYRSVLPIGAIQSTEVAKIFLLHSTVVKLSVLIMQRVRNIVITARNSETRKQISPTRNIKKPSFRRNFHFFSRETLINSTNPRGEPLSLQNAFSKP